MPKKFQRLSNQGSCSWTWGEFTFYSLRKAGAFSSFHAREIVMEQIELSEAALGR
jgi:hypothetical protein